MFWSTFFGFFSAVLAGVVVQVFIRLFDEKYLQPIRNYNIVRRKILSAITMYAPQYSQPHSIPTGEPLNAPYHIAASTAFRELASELGGVLASFYEADLSEKGLNGYRERKRKQITECLQKRLPDLIVLEEVQKDLMRLSNSLFLPCGAKDDKHEQADGNMEVTQEICIKLHSNKR